VIVTAMLPVDAGPIEPREHAEPASTVPIVVAVSVINWRILRSQPTQVITDPSGESENIAANRAKLLSD
jgi:hypothetical protein